MIGDIAILLAKEFKAFFGGDKGSFLIYLVLICSWSVLFAGANGSSNGLAGPLWIVFFAILISANFSNTVFISERTSGALEILITSGLSRSAILYGKMLFVILVTIILGFTCAAAALLLRPVFAGTAMPIDLFSVSDLLLFAVASFVCAGSGAYFSVRLPNPRLLHFVNILIIGLPAAGYTLAKAFHPVSVHVLIAALVILGALFTMLAKREFNGEKIIQPVLL